MHVRFYDTILKTIGPVFPGTRKPDAWRLTIATCFDVAEYFLANKDADDEITMLKLQKLCAYAQAYALALLDRPLFENQILACTHGPVIEEIYNAWRSVGRNPITTVSSRTDARLPFTDEELFALETVNNYYGAYSASRLRNMSHADFPGNFGSREVIAQSDIKEKLGENRVIRAIQDAA